MYCVSNKSKLDQYYTKPLVADRLSSIIKHRYGGNYRYVEPSAGLGAFSNNFKDIIKFDIDAKISDCICADFLTVTDLPDGCVYIGNPPFGFAGNLALKFVNHCCYTLNAKAVCFILPKTFQKVFFQNKINLNYHKIYEEFLDKNSFLLDGNEYNVPCVFQIWEKKGYERNLVKTDISKYFEVVDKTQAQYAIRRVGGKAGKVLDGLNHSETSTYFVKMDDIIKNEIDLLYPKIKQIAEQTVGVRSITLQEISWLLDINFKT